MKGYITVFADASFDHQTKSAGIAFWCRDDNNILQHAQRVQWQVESSGEAELIALCTGIVFALDHIPSQPGYIVVVQSDCDQALKMLLGYLPVNQTQKAFVDMAMSVICRAGAILRTKHVKAHTGDDDRRSFVNRWCDQHARRNMRYEREQRRKQVRVKQDEKQQN